MTVIDCEGAFSDYDGQGCARGICSFCELDASAHDFDPLSSPSAVTPDEPASRPADPKGQEPA